MIVFALAAAALVALALSFVLPPLVRAQAAAAGVAPAAPRRGPAWAVGLGLPLVAAVLYAAIGTPQALLAPPSLPDAPGTEGVASTAAIGPAQIEAMVARLAARLKNEPDDVDGWRMLAHSYETLRRFDAAAGAYRRLIALEPNNADALTDCAVALAMLIDRALAINPNHVQALALKGSAAYEHGDYARAIGPWKKILAMVPPDSEMAKSIGASVEKAEAFAKNKGTGKP
jgi:cytochrome c-type biogenesis protein CcmH/NrfG